MASKGDQVGRKNNFKGDQIYTDNPQIEIELILRLY